MTLLKQVAHQRATIYRWFSSLLFQELDEEQLRQLESEEVQRWLLSLGNIGELQTTVETLLYRLEVVLRREDRQLELAADFASLFLQPPPSGVSPYAGHYPHTTPDQVRREMRRLMVRYSLTPAANEAADHIAIQLSLMVTLIDQQAETVQQHHFLHTHLASWLPLFKECCVAQDAGGFYSQVVCLIANFVHEDVHWLCGIIADSPDA